MGYKCNYLLRFCGRDHILVTIKSYNLQLLASKLNFVHGCTGTSKFVLLYCNACPTGVFACNYPQANLTDVASKIAVISDFTGCRDPKECSGEMNVKSKRGKC